MDGVVAASAAENNLRLFASFARKLAQDDLAVYASFAHKFAQWLSDPRAYYPQARPEVPSQSLPRPCTPVQRHITDRQASHCMCAAMSRGARFTLF